MTAKNEFEGKIGQAWKAHYSGQDSAALDQFQQLVQSYPDHVDVLWGLGLAYRRAGNFEEARRVFAHAQTLILAELEHSPESHERALMLKRMVEQQLSQMDKFLR